jgi:hypothetical protein
MAWSYWPRFPFPVSRRTILSAVRSVKLEDVEHLQCVEQRLLGGWLVWVQ